MLVEMSQITRTFPGVVANDQVDFSLREGEVHALLGENGAGKTTLMKILSGFLKPDSGEIRVRDQIRTFASPAEAIDAGVGMVHQHFKLVTSFTAAENIVMGHPSCPTHVRKTKMEEQVQEIADRYRFDIDPSSKIWQLSVGEQQRVEVLKALYRGADVLILDEPTAVLTPQEARELFDALQEMKDRGHGIAFITHKLDEVMKVAERVTVLREGKNVATLDVSETSEEELARLMVGEDVSLDVEKTESGTIGDVVLEVRDLTVQSDRGTRALDQFNLDVRAGEIVGLAGVAGNGQRELAESLAGLREIESGQVLVGGQDVTNANPHSILDAGLSLIPPDRQETGLVPGLDMIENCILHEFRRRPISRWGFLNYGAARERTLQMIDGFDVRYTDLKSKVRFLSGGNQQKLLLARELGADPRIIVAVYPARGLDVAAMKAVHRTLLESRKKGRGILLISESLDELLKLSDRIPVIFSGRIVDTFPPDSSKREQIGLAMGGQMDRADESRTEQPVKE